VPEQIAATVVLPCLDEAQALPWVLGRIPPGVTALVADNGSSDGSAEVAAQHGATVLAVPRRGYGAAVHAGIEAATTPVVAVMDCDATLDPAQLPPLIRAVADGRADMAVCRRRPQGRGVFPWHARLGTAVLAAWLRASTPLRVHDLAPVRVFDRRRYLTLGVVDRGFGYPMEVMVSVGRAGWRVEEFDMAYRRREGASKVAGTWRGSLRATSALLRAAPRRRVPRQDGAG
jgi:glycosyltransferase involved in cell wall biosynthesis